MQDTMSREDDRYVVEALIANDPAMIEEFFFIRCRAALEYIGQYFCGSKESPESLVGEFYEYLADKDWHKLRIFKYSCSLNTYVSVVATRYFQNKRNMREVSLEVFPLPPDGESVDPADSFTHSDVQHIVYGMKPLDRFLIERILIDGEKPSDIMDEVRIYMKEELVDSMDRKQLSGYIYTRYSRARQKLQEQLISLGYGA